jgi:hypothetical protein
MKMFMKKTLFCSCIVFITFAVSGLNAQKFYFGIQTGVNRSNIHVTERATYFLKGSLYKPFISYAINGYLSYKSNSNWGISIEPGFIQKGGMRVPIALFGPNEWKNSSSYFQFPILYDLYFFKNFSFSIGPEFTYLLKSQDSDIAITNHTFAPRKNVEIGGLAGIQYNIHKVVDVGLRYGHSLSATYRVWYDDFGDSVGLSTEYNSYFQVFLRFKI